MNPADLLLRSARDLRDIVFKMDIDAASAAKTVAHEADQARGRRARASVVDLAEDRWLRLVRLITPDRSDGRGYPALLVQFARAVNALGVSWKFSSDGAVAEFLLADEVPGAVVMPGHPLDLPGHWASLGLYYSDPPRALINSRTVLARAVKGRRASVLSSAYPELLPASPYSETRHAIGPMPDAEGNRHGFEIVAAEDFLEAVSRMSPQQGSKPDRALGAAAALAAAAEVVHRCYEFVDALAESVASSPRLAQMATRLGPWGPDEVSAMKRVLAPVADPGLSLHARVPQLAASLPVGPDFKKVAISALPEIESALRATGINVSVVNGPVVGLPRRTDVLSVEGSLFYRDPEAHWDQDQPCAISVVASLWKLREQLEAIVRSGPGPSWPPHGLVECLERCVTLLDRPIRDPSEWPDSSRWLERGDQWWALL